MRWQADHKQQTQIKQHTYQSINIKKSVDAIKQKVQSKRKAVTLTAAKAVPQLAALVVHQQAATVERQPAATAAC